eukprot:6054490-Karenia_brevis.AAC.1
MQHNATTRRTMVSIERANTRKMWVCPVCGSPFSSKACPFLLGTRTGTEPEDISFLKAAFPDQKG